MPFYFATDCGTMYAPFLLAELVLHMRRYPTCAACTGMQRIMDTEDQRDPVFAEPETWAEGVLRSVQAFDFQCVTAGEGSSPLLCDPCSSTLLHLLTTTPPPLQVRARHFQRHARQCSLPPRLTRAVRAVPH